ncbi:MAG: stage V sporulation protein AB [Firmicutes bacterium]|nr:stage V sporulation protein AB [Bacillota bacterium]
MSAGILAEIIVGLASGLMVAGGVFAVVVIISIVPRMAQLSNGKHILLYESCISAGISTGGWHLLYPLQLQMFGEFGNVVCGIFFGVFVGCLAVAIAEVLDVIPILCRRSKLVQKLPWLLLAISLGKTAGTLAYFLLPGFTQYK